MDDVRIGSVVRAVRIRRRWRQSDLAARTDTSRAAISRIEHGQAGSLPLDTLRRVCGALEMRLDVIPRWRGGDLDRLLNARHAAMAETMAASFARLPDWVLRPEISFSIYGERGVIDFAAWHPTSRSLLLIELKTELVDIGDLMSTTDRRRRLAGRIVSELGWHPARVGVWVAIEETATNARRIRRYSNVLRAAFPDGGRALAGWLRRPGSPIAALSLVSPRAGCLSDARSLSIRRVAAPRRAPPTPAPRAAEREAPWAGARRGPQQADEPPNDHGRSI